MFKTISIVFTLILVGLLPITNSLAAGGTSTEYPNYVDTDSNYDIKLLKPLSSVL